jgi:hypothetical protein
MRKVLASAGMLCALTGCDLPPIPQSVTAVKPSVYHDIAYYDANPLARDQANAWCHDNQGLAAKVPSCDNADISGIHALDRQMGWLK